MIYRYFEYKFNYYRSLNLLTINDPVLHNTESDIKRISKIRSKIVKYKIILERLERRKKYERKKYHY